MRVSQAEDKIGENVATHEHGRVTPFIHSPIFRQNPAPAEPNQRRPSLVAPFFLHPCETDSPQWRPSPLHEPTRRIVDIQAHASHTVARETHRRLPDAQLAPEVLGPRRQRVISR